MESNKQLKKLISIKNMLQIVNYLSNEYMTYEEKDFNKDNIVNRGIVYKLLCSNMFNLIDAIKRSQYLFENVQSEYSLFQKKINKSYCIENRKYYEKIDKEMTLFELLRDMRNEMNHFEKDVNDQITMFEIEVRYEHIEELRKIIEDLINKKIENIDKQMMKKIILSRPKIIYEVDKIENVVLNFEEKIKETVMDDKYKNELIYMAKTMGNIFSPNFILGLINEESDSIEILDMELEKIRKLSDQYDEEVLKYGTKQDIENYNKMKSIIKKFESDNETTGLSAYKNNIENFVKEIVEIYKVNNNS